MQALIDQLSDRRSNYDALNTAIIEIGKKATGSIPEQAELTRLGGIKILSQLFNINPRLRLTLLTTLELLITGQPERKKEVFDTLKYNAGNYCPSFLHLIAVCLRDNPALQIAGLNTAAITELGNTMIDHDFTEDQQIHLLSEIGSHNPKILAQFFNLCDSSLRPALSRVLEALITDHPDRKKEVFDTLHFRTGQYSKFFLNLTAVCLRDNPALQIEGLLTAGIEELGNTMIYHKFTEAQQRHLLSEIGSHNPKILAQFFNLCGSRLHPAVVVMLTIADISLYSESIRNLLTPLLTDPITLPATSQLIQRLRREEYDFINPAPLGAAILSTLTKLPGGYEFLMEILSIPELEISAIRSIENARTLILSVMQSLPETDFRRVQFENDCDPKLPKEAKDPLGLLIFNIFNGAPRPTSTVACGGAGGAASEDTASVALESAESILFKALLLRSPSETGPGSLSAFLTEQGMSNTAAHTKLMKRLETDSTRQETITALLKALRPQCTAGSGLPLAVLNNAEIMPNTSILFGLDAAEQQAKIKPLSDTEQARFDAWSEVHL